MYSRATVHCHMWVPVWEEDPGFWLNCMHLFVNITLDKQVEVGNFGWRPNHKKNLDWGKCSFILTFCHQKPLNRRTHLTTFIYKFNKIYGVNKDTSRIKKGVWQIMEKLGPSTNLILSWVSETYNFCKFNPAYFWPLVHCT